MKLIGENKLYLIKGLSIVLLYCMLGFMSCKSKKQLASQSQGDEQVNDSTTVIFTMKSSPCFGHCKVFDLTLYEDQRLVINAKENLPFEGEKLHQLTTEEFSRFNDLLETIDWDQLESRYESGATDMQALEFSYRSNDSIHDIYVYGFEPKKLHTLYKKIVELYIQ